MLVKRRLQFILCVLFLAPMHYTDKQFAEWGAQGGRKAASNMSKAQLKARAKKARAARDIKPTKRKRNGKLHAK